MSNLLTSMGEVLIDFLPIEENNQTVGFRMYPGGSPFNVAVGLVRLGQTVAFTSKISSDFFGRFLRSSIENEGIDTRFLLDSAAPSTLAFVAMEYAEPAYSFYGEGAADSLILPSEIPEALLDETRLLHIGSISLLRGTTPEAVLATAEKLKGQALISFDPNVRPGLVTDEAAYRDLLDRLFVLADIVKISVADLAWFAPLQSFEEAATDILARGPGLVVVTRGGTGALALRAATRTAVQSESTSVAAGGVVYTQVPFYPVAVVDTVGAGDAFSAGLLAGLAERDITSRAPLANMSSDDLAEVLRFASATASHTCTRPGSDPPTRSEVYAFLESAGKERV